MVEHLERIARESRKYRDNDPADRALGKGRFRNAGYGGRGGWGGRA